jgi:enamine deaminase RidA (YjgF/YER057c/UK114 family)
LSSVEKKIAELGLKLPESTKPLAAYIPAVQSGNLVFTSGQLPMKDGALLETGKVGAEVSKERAKELAAVCALNALAAAKTVIDDLDKIVKVVKLVGYVASDPDFIEQPAVINGASELLGQILGERGSHARTAIGVAVLPLNAPVEIELVLEVSR